jgi:hypothetical protein
VFRDCRPGTDRKDGGMGFITGVGAYLVGAISQSYGQDRARNPLLHHQPRAGRRTTELGNPPALGHRKQATLDTGRRLQRRPGPKTRRPCRAEFLHPQSHRPQPTQKRKNAPARCQGKTAQSRLGPSISAQITGNLICVGHGMNRPICKFSLLDAHHGDRKLRGGQSDRAKDRRGASLAFWLYDR